MTHSDVTKDFERLGLDPLPEGWKYMPLGELVDSTRGISYGIVQPGSYVQNGTPIVRVNNLKNGRIIVDDILRVSQTIEEKYQRTRLRGGEVLLSLVGSLGQTSVVPQELKGWNVARAVAVIPVLANINPEWVNYALRSPQLQHYIWTWATTTVQATLNLGDVVRLPIPIPSEKERQTIIEVLGALDDKIELNRRMSRTLESLARAVFRQWFVENIDVDTWEAKTLGEVLSVLETGSRPKGGVTGEPIGVPSVGAESIVKIGSFDFSKTKYVSTEFYESMRRGHVEDRDVLLYKDGGRPGEFEPHVAMFGGGFPFEKFSINEHVYRLRVAQPFSQEYFYSWLESDEIMEEMRSRGTGVAIPGLNSTALSGISISIPPEKLLNDFTNYAEPLISKIFANAKESRTLASLRDSLLPKLMRGEVRVRVK